MTEVTQEQIEAEIITFADARISIGQEIMEYISKGNSATVDGLITLLNKEAVITHPHVDNDFWVSEKMDFKLSVYQASSDITIGLMSQLWGLVEVSQRYEELFGEVVSDATPLYR